MGDLVFFDIDGTLFDPQKFGQQIRAEFIKILNISEEELIRANADYYAKLEESTDFDPRDLVSFISSRFNHPREKLDSVFWENDTIYRESFFPETEDVVSKLSKNHTLGIFSQGNEELQIRKLTAGGLIKFFHEENIILRPRKLLDESIALLPRDATVIDNKHDVVTILASFVNVIWVNRRTEDSDLNIQTIHSLRELIVSQ